MILKLLSTVAQVRYEDAGGKVLARIQRDKRGVCVLIGEVPSDRPHYQVVVYVNPLRAEDKTFVPSKSLTPHPGPLPVEGRGSKPWRDTSPMKPTRAD